VACKPHEELFEAIEHRLGRFILHAKFLAYLVVKILQQLAASPGHSFVDLEAELELKPIEGCLDLLGFPAALVNVVDALLKKNWDYCSRLSGKGVCASFLLKSKAQARDGFIG
jgi:hypothetical protein